jgi:integrase
MNEKFRFTTGRLDRLTCPPGSERIYVRDDLTQGLQLCVTPKSKTFILQRRLAGKQTRVRLGQYPGELTIDAARKAAAMANGEIAKGIDPRQAKRKARAEMTFGELFVLHLEEAKRHNKSWREDEKQFNLYLSRDWKNRRLGEITRADVQQMHLRIGERGKYSANRTLALIGHMFRRTAADHGWTGGNPAAGIQKFKEKSRERFLHADELPKLYAALEDSTMADFFKIALMTGARRGNVQSMRWEDISIDRAEWRIPEMKNGMPQTIPLSPESVGILTRRMSIASDSPFVFPARSGGGHLQSPNREWRRVCKMAGIADLRLHDLRRTLGSWMAGAGVSTTIVGKTLGHKSQTATAIYARLALESVRNAVNIANAALDAAGKGENNGTI